MLQTQAVLPRAEVSFIDRKKKKGIRLDWSFPSDPPGGAEAGSWDNGTAKRSANLRLLWLTFWFWDAVCLFRSGPLVPSDSLEVRKQLDFDLTFSLHDSFLVCVVVRPHLRQWPPMTFIITQDMPVLSVPKHTRNLLCSEEAIHIMHT